MDNNYPPFSFQAPNGKLQGILVDQWRLWQQKTGVKVQLYALDWAEAQRRMDAGEFDVIDTLFKTEARLKNTISRHPIRQSNNRSFLMPRLAASRMPPRYRGSRWRSRRAVPSSVP